MKIILILLCMAMMVLSHRRREKDRIRYLPGLWHFPKFRQYSGYLDAGNGNRLFYWFVESENDPKNDPLVLWLNGGPGCSSLKGFLMEIGPFRINPDGRTLSRFEQRWNKIANIFFMESPAGVGYSYNVNNEENTTWSDNGTAEINYAAVKSFFKKYPKYQTNEFFVTGESYGGIYVPTLCSKLVKDPSINFKGFAVGNPITSFSILRNSIRVYSYHHGFIDDNLWTQMRAECCTGEDLNSDCKFGGDGASANCSALVQQSRDTWKGITIYNFVQPCFTRTDGVIQSYPCINTIPIELYLNSSRVQRALHVAPGVTWGTTCNEDVWQNYTRHTDISKNYKEVIDAGGRVVVYNGDLDILVNNVGTRWFVDSLQLPQVGEFKQWTYTEKDGSTQVAGFVKQFQSLKLVFVKGAGHSVPTDTPQQAFDIFQRFLKNQDY